MDVCDKIRWRLRMRWLGALSLCCPYRVTRNFYITVFIFPGINFGITLHSLRNARLFIILFVLNFWRVCSQFWLSVRNFI